MTIIGGLFLFVCILHNVFHIALQNSAKHIDGVCADAFISFQSCELAGADVVPLDQSVLGDAFFFQDLPEIVISNHKTPPFY